MKPKDRRDESDQRIDKPEICANVVIGLTKVKTFLLDRQLKTLEEQFLEQGGLREAMTRARLASRNRRRTQP
jgi:four helix bundle suffix protein